MNPGDGVKGPFFYGPLTPSPGTISGVIFSCSNAIKSIYLNGIYLSSKGDEIYGKQMPELRRNTAV